MTKFHLDNPPRKPSSYNDGRDALGKIGFDAPRESPDFALELMVHHLKLAAMYYEGCPPSDVANSEEMERILASEIPGHVTPELTGARVWMQAMHKYYADLKREQDDVDGPEED